MSTTTVTKAHQLVERVKAQHSHLFRTDEDGYALCQNADIIIAERDGGSVEIIWETGPDEWTYSFPGGGCDPEFGTTIRPVSTGSMVPGDDFDSQTSYSLVVYPGS
jgi:hypothetical protein